ncbi:hypothetical protein [Aquimarina macrocephali]|uniref:hypothetical protein n=1 Tax=Aquimarina macrocephali TaxID=666563 RepID=UPI0004652C86|nr:hypothetical protein [Aquimarina macrocephali]
MKNLIKYILLGLNVIVFIAIYLWYKKDSGYEPIVVLITQTISVLAILFEKQLSGGSSTTISRISGSEIDATVTGNGNLDIKDVEKGAKVKYKKEK